MPELYTEDDGESDCTGCVYQSEGIGFCKTRHHKCADLDSIFIAPGKEAKGEYLAVRARKRLGVRHEDD